MICRTESQHTKPRIISALGGVNQVEATAFVLRVLSENPSLKTQITGFEQKVEAIDDEGQTNKAFADIIKKGNVNVECKSWFPNGTAFQFFVAGNGSYGQFITYLNSIGSLDELEYWFDNRKATIGDIKQKFKQLFTTKAQDILTSLGPVKFNALFGTNNLTAFLSTTINDFTSVDNIYRFIYVK